MRIVGDGRDDFGLVCRVEAVEEVESALNIITFQMAQDVLDDHAGPLRSGYGPVARWLVVFVMSVFHRIARVRTSL